MRDSEDFLSLLILVLVWFGLVEFELVLVWFGLVEFELVLVYHLSVVENSS